MNLQESHLIKSLFNKDSLSSCTKEELQKMADDHPCFATAQYLLAKKMQETEDNNFETQLNKTALYFHNPLYLDIIFFKSTKNAVDEIAVKESTADVSNTSLQKNEPEDIIFPDDEHEDTEVLTELAEDHFLEKSGLESEKVISEPEQLITITETAISENTEVKENIAEIEKQKEQAEPEVYQEIINEQTDIYTIPEPEEFFNDELVVENTQQPIVEPTSVPIQGIEDEELYEEDEAAVDLPPIKMPNDFSTPLKNLSEATLIEPYHTVDYFASQGIKIDVEDVPVDKFGKQLKSFTEWLQVMKKLPSRQGGSPLEDKPDDPEVNNMAAHSLDVKEALTEAMAEVWLKQGNKEKAAEIYTKLGLLNPAKSAYFASLIEKTKA